MGEFYMKPKPVREQAQNMLQIKQELQQLEHRLLKITSSDVLSSSSYAGVKKALGSLIEQLETEKDSLNVLGDTLDEIVNTYEKTEALICSKDTDNNANDKTKSDTETDANVEYIALQKLAGIKEWVQGLEEAWNEFLKEFAKVLAEIDYTVTDLIELPFDVPELMELLYDAYQNGDDVKAALISYALAYIPTHIYDQSVLAVFDLLAELTNIPQDVTDEHLQNNKEVWSANQQDYKIGDYIEFQNAMAEFLYGQQNDTLSDLLLGGADLNGLYNTCEVIAAYNALVALNNGTSPVDFPDMLAYFEQNGAMLDGYFGTSPNALMDYFEDNNYDACMLSGGQITSDNLLTMSNDYDTFILTTYNNDINVSDQVHTISITCENGKYELHNDYSRTFQISETSKKYNSLEEAINAYRNNSSEPISVIGVR